MNTPANAGDDFEERLRRGAVLRLTLDKATLDDPDIDTRSKYVIVVNALLPDDDVWFIVCTSKPGHFDKNPRFANDTLRWEPGEYPWCKSAVTVVDCTTVHNLPTARLKERYANGHLVFAGDLRPAHLERIDAIMKASIFLSPEDKRWVLNYVVADTKKWEQEAAYHIDTHPVVDAFVKNAGLGFAIPYLHNGQPHDYVPDFVVRLKTTPAVHLILETKGFDDLAEVKAAAAERWVAAVNADGTFGTWRYALARKIAQVRQVLDGSC